MYPNSNWEEKVQDYKDTVTELTVKYKRQLELQKIPIILLNGGTIKLSPGKHNQLHVDIVHEFYSRFVGVGGRLLFIGDTASSRNEGGKLMLLEAYCLESLGVPPMSHDRLPDIVVL